MIYTAYLLRVGGKVDPIAADFGQEAGYALGRSSIYRKDKQPFTLTYNSVQFYSIYLYSTFNNITFVNGLHLIDVEFEAKFISESRFIFVLQVMSCDLNRMTALKRYLGVPQIFLIKAETVESS